MISSSNRRHLFILNVLPKEILYNIFDFLWAHDILYAFLNINDQFNTVLSAYQDYNVNFKSILKWQFDLVCSVVQPNQIKSLVLSDNNESPNQSTLFLSRFSIEQLVNLRALTLSNIENDHDPLFVNIFQLQHLDYFQTDTLSHLWMIQKTPRLKQLIINGFTVNDYNHMNSLSSISFSYLYKLTLSYCSYVQLRQILCLAPKIKSLNISLTISDCTGIDYFAEQHQEASLRINCLTMSIHSFSK